MTDLRVPMVTPAFASIPGGWFTMGTLQGQEDERPPHPVFIDRFELGVCPVTRAEYACFLDATGHDLPREWSHSPFAHADLPVVGVSCRSVLQATSQALASIAGRFLTGTTAGSLIEAVGYVNFYLLTTLVAMPGVLLFWYMIRSGLADVSIGFGG